MVLFVGFGYWLGVMPEHHLLYIKNRQRDQKSTIKFNLARDMWGNAMIHHSVDVASRVSSRLSELLRSRSNDPECEQPITLIAARRFLADLLPSDFRETERMHHFDIDASMLDEMDALIEEFGEGALAVDFVQAHASEQLSRAIESLVDDENRENPPTLSAVRDAIVSGLGVRLVGEGVLEEDEDDTLVEEIDALIEQFGADSLAEEFLRYE